MIAAHRHPRSRFARPGFMLTEVLIALAVLAGAAVLVAQLATWSLAERARTEAQLEAVQAAANVLESGRARSWRDLTPEWASDQKLPYHLAVRRPDCRLTVRVEPEEKRPRIKRLTVEVKWTDKARVGWPPVVLVALFADRTTEGSP